MKLFMKNILLFGLFLFVFAVLFSSCSRGSGCPAESAAGNVDKRGQLTTKPGKSALFDKKTTKAMRN
jgi:hypothetical protein